MNERKKLMKIEYFLCVFLLFISNEKFDGNRNNQLNNNEFCKFLLMKRFLDFKIFKVSIQYVDTVWTDETNKNLELTACLYVDSVTMIYINESHLRE